MCPSVSSSGGSRAIGVSPHHYIRIVRFRKAMRLMKARRFHRLSDLAYDLNYVDQSHFIKDSKAFSGYAPGRLVRTVQSGVELPCAFVLSPADVYGWRTFMEGNIAPSNRSC